MRVAIIGAGGVGSMAAWRIAQSGHEVIVYEQFAVDHEFGSSYGGSRLLRQVYPDPLYTRLMASSFALWNELQQQMPNKELIVRRGGLFFGPTDHPLLAQARNALNTNSVAFSELSANVVNNTYSGIRLTYNEVALYEPGMGFARASDCVKAALELAKRHDCTVREHCSIVKIEAGTNVRVTTSNGDRSEFDRVILTTGAWINALLKPLGIEIPVKVTRQIYCHLEQDKMSYNFSDFPVWIDCNTLYYGFPQMAGEDGVKLARHFSGNPTEPNRVNRIVATDDLAEMIEYALYRLPGLLPTPLSSSVCLYTSTPDEDFVVDALPNDPRIIVISACSGHGFKFTPLMGEIALQLATQGATHYDISRFSLGRF